jgi:putative RNA 2'-phosphotransferase
VTFHFDSEMNVATNDIKKVSEFLSYVLRHRPDEIGLTLDANGWASVSDLIKRSKADSVALTEESIREIVRCSDKQPFALSDDGAMIRANQGHSVEVDLALNPQQPPEILFHGTATRFLDLIRHDGLKPMRRQHVHLSFDEGTATQVGQRHGMPVVLRIKAGEMWRAGTTFYLSANGVWLTERVVASFLEFPL